MGSLIDQSDLHIRPYTQNFPDILDCSIPQATDAITPEEREEVKVSGQYRSVSPRQLFCFTSELSCVIQFSF